MTRLTDAEYLISSVALSIDEYYAGVGESPGVWTGRWSEKLGLAGVVEAGELRALVEGKHPATGEDLLAGSRPRKVRAFDLTFSAPKSVSLLWAFASEQVAEAVAAAHREAADGGVGVLGGAVGGGPGPVAWNTPAGGRGGLGGGRVHA